MPGEIQSRLCLDNGEQTIKLRQGDLPGQLRYQVIFSPFADEGDSFL